MREQNRRVSNPKTREEAGHRKFGCQTLIRGLDVLEAVSSGASNLTELSKTVKLNRSTAYRMASALVQRGYLSLVDGQGYGLGPKALEIGYQAQTQLYIPRLARQHLEELASQTRDTVHLGIRDGTTALYLDKVPGCRRVEISSRVGELQPLRSTGLGKALLLDETEAWLRKFYRSGNQSEHSNAISEDAWIQRMKVYAGQGVAFDLEENEDRIRCVAAPIRDATGKIKAAISVSSAAHYMNDERMRVLADDVKRTATIISRGLGWEEPRVTSMTTDRVETFPRIAPA